jgi:hypothetical protein
MSKTEQDKNPITKRTKKKKTKKDKKKQKKKDKSKIPKGITININVGKSGADPKPKMPKTAKGFAARTTSLRGQRGKGNLSDNSRQAEMNANIMQNVSGIRSSAMQQGLDLKDLTGNFDVLRRRVDGLGTQVINVQNQQTAGGVRDTAFQDGVNLAIKENAERQQKALDIMQRNIRGEVKNTRESTRLGLQNARKALDAVAQSQLEYRQEVQQGMQDTADRQQQALEMMRESLTQGITRDLESVRGSIDEQSNNVLKLQTDVNRGVGAINRLQTDMTSGINAFSTLRNDMDTGMAWLARQGAMNTEATQQIAGNTGAMEALADIYGDEFQPKEILSTTQTPAIEMPPQTPTQTDSRVSSSVDPQQNERPLLGNQPQKTADETLNKPKKGRPSGSKSQFQYKNNPILDDFFEEVIAIQQDTGKRVDWGSKPFIIDLIENQGAKLPQLRNRLSEMNTQRTEDKFFEELDKDRQAAVNKDKKKGKKKDKKKSNPNI